MIDLSVKTGQAEKQRNLCVMAGVFEKRKLSEAASRLDAQHSGFISKTLQSTQFEGKPGQALWLCALPNAIHDSVLLVGCGPAAEFNEKAYQQAVRRAVQKFNELGLGQAMCYLTDLVVPHRDTAWKTYQAALIALDLSYEFNTFKSKDATLKKTKTVQKLMFNVAQRRELPAAEASLTQATTVARGMGLAKDLINTPPNVCTPTYLANKALELGKKHKKLNVAVLDEKEIKALKMGAFLAVAQASAEPPKFITLQYRGGRASEKPIVFVGKGVTVDTGGVCLKPGSGMAGMKYDMSGAATVLGVLTIAVELELPLNLIGLIPTTENMVGGSAYRVDDILTSMSGQTIEVLNTDAEGRLILCDALTYAERFEPEAVIDIATLTGACVVALGRHASAVFSNHEPLAQDLLQAGVSSGDRLWQLPLWEEYQEQLSSVVADMVNVGGPEGGSITAACFLSRFTKKYHWAHLDIAGTACRASGKERMASGRPIPALIQYLQDRSARSKR